MRFAPILLGILLGGAAPWLPNPATTPGAIDGGASRAQICRHGWSTRSIRPPVAYTEALKRHQLRDHADRRSWHYEEDHLVSLDLGGAPRDPRNLWPEPRAGACGAAVKDRLEWVLHQRVCAGGVPLGVAQRAIAADWVGAYRRWVGPLRCGG